MQMQHKNKGFTIQVTSKRGQPLVNKKGLVNIEKGQYRRCDAISIEALKEKFERIA